MWFFVGNFRKCVVFAKAKMVLNKGRFDTFFMYSRLHNPYIDDLMPHNHHFSHKLKMFRKTCKFAENFDACNANVCGFH